MIGKKIYKWIEDVFYFNRSLTGEGNKKTLNYLKIINKDIIIKKIKSGTKVFDWKVPKEWSVKEAWVKDDKGKKIINFKKNNLHLVGYSKPVNKILTYKNLLKKIHTIKKIPSAIPYVTSYYNSDWGFCISENLKKRLNKKIKYHAYIDSKLDNGNLIFGELFYKGKSKKEIFFSSNICHPSMANNELSGPMIQLALSNYVKKIKNRKYSYRFLFIPETIGSISYLSKNLSRCKKNIFAGFVLTCLGNNTKFSYLESRSGNTLADMIILKNFKSKKIDYKKFSFLERGSDERQYCSPNIDLPVCSLMRLKYREYKEYHTSKDNLSFISAKGLQSSYQFIVDCINDLERQIRPESTVLCEPHLSKYNLYPKISKVSGLSRQPSRDFINILAYSDGKNDITDISKKIGLSYSNIISKIRILKKYKLIKY